MIEAPFSRWLEDDCDGATLWKLDQKEINDTLVIFSLCLSLFISFLRLTTVMESTLLDKVPEGTRSLSLAKER